MADTSAQSLDQLLGAFETVTGQIDYDVRLKRGDLLSEGSARFLRLPVQYDLRDLAPRVIRLVRFPLTAAHAGHAMPGLRQTRREVGPDVAGSSDDNYGFRTRGRRQAVRSPGPRSGIRRSRN